MTGKTDRFELASDNTAAICPEAWAELEAANSDSAAAYGDDQWTARVCNLVRETFETDCEVYFVLNGTAANALALAQLCRSFHSTICHEFAHIETDECGAPEFFSGGSKLIPARGANGKIDLDQVKAAIDRQHGLHSPKPRVLSVSQSTELGTVYAIDELQRIAEFSREHDLYVHMDGARFANAVASIGCKPKTISWEAGVDVLCLGGTKIGTGAGDLVVFFRKELAREFEYRVKQAGQLPSKMRYIAAPWIGLLRNDVWIRNAGHANSAAQTLATKLRKLPGIEPVFPCQASAVFLKMSDSMVKGLQARGWQFYRYIEPDIYRFMCSWSVTPQVIDDFVGDVTSLQQV